MSIPDDGDLCEQIRANGLFRRFVGLEAGCRWTARLVGVSRARLFETGLAPSLFVRVLAHVDVAAVVGDDRLRVDIVRLEGWARHAAMSDVDTPPTALGSVLLLPRMSDAYPFLPYLHGRAEGTPLERVLGRLRSALPGPLAVAAYSALTAGAPVRSRRVRLRGACGHARPLFTDYSAHRGRVTPERRQPCGVGARGGPSADALHPGPVPSARPNRQRPHGGQRCASGRRRTDLHERLPPSHAERRPETHRRQPRRMGRVVAPAHGAHDGRSLPLERPATRGGSQPATTDRRREPR